MTCYRPSFSPEPRPVYPSYEDSKLTQVVLQKTKRFKQQLSDGEVLNMAATTAYGVTAFHICLGNRHKINVLVFGGACGNHYWRLKNLFPHCTFNWAVVETPAMCTVAKELQNDELHFFDDIHIAASELGHIDLLFTSGALMFPKNPQGFLKTLVALGADHIFITRISLTSGDKDIVTVQKSWLSENGIGELPEGYTDRIIKYPNTTMNKADFDAILSSSYMVRAKFNDETPIEPINNEPVFGYSALFQKTV